MMNAKPGTLSPAVRVRSRPGGPVPARDSRADGSDRSLRLAIVEDNLLIALDIEMGIADAGHQVLGPATTADEAVALARSERPDAILMDLRLADGSCGSTAARTILDRWGIRCVFLSGNLTPEKRHELEALDPIAMLGKPFSPQALQGAIDAVRDSARPDRARPA